MRMEISLKEYKLYTYRYMKPGQYILTKHGKPVYKVVVSEVATLDTKLEAPVYTDHSRYRCGCTRVDSFLCPKHSRQ